MEHGVPLKENYLHIDSPGYKVGGTKMSLSSSSATLIHLNSLFSFRRSSTFVSLPSFVITNWRKIQQRKNNPQTRQVATQYFRKPEPRASPLCCTRWRYLHIRMCIQTEKSGAATLIPGQPLAIRLASRPNCPAQLSVWTLSYVYYISRSARCVA